MGKTVLLRACAKAPRELKYALALADLGPGIHTVAEVAAARIFSPSPGLIEFRMPLSERYIASHREELDRRARLPAKPER